MFLKLIVHSFRRDLKRKAVAISAVMLATCLATFLLNWSLNLGDKLQRDLRAYGANILIVPAGESLPLAAGGLEMRLAEGDRYLDGREISELDDIFWRNQVVAYSPMLPQNVSFKGENVMMIGTEFGERHPEASYPAAAPYLSLEGQWPGREGEAVSGASLAARFGWKQGSRIQLDSQGRQAAFLITGIVRSGGAEDQQLFARLMDVQILTGTENRFKQLLVSALVTSKNDLYRKFERDPDSLSPQEHERYFCTPYVDSVAADIAAALTGSEPRVVRQISQSEEKITQKVNWLMVLVTLAALVASSLTMTSTVTAMILERKKELALMKAIGSQKGFLFSYLLSEILLLGLAGSLAGYGIGSALSVSLSRSIFESVFELKAVVLPLVVLVGILIILCGSIFPLNRAMSLQPSEALRDL